MERQTIYTSATRLGPFWTLILEIASGKTSQTAAALPCGTSREAGGSSASSALHDARGFEAVSGPVSQPGGTSEAYRLPSQSAYPGPFITLILSMHKHRDKRNAIGYPAVPLRVGVTG